MQGLEFAITKRMLEKTVELQVETSEYLILFARFYDCVNDWMDEFVSPIPVHPGKVFKPLLLLDLEKLFD